MPYLTFACAIGMTKNEVDVFFNRFTNTINQMRNKILKKQINNDMLT